MTSGTQTRSSKTDRRQALETPYQRESEASVERAMSRGIQPKGIDQLIRWFRECCHDEAPMTVHKNEIWRDWGHDGNGGSKLGTMAHSDPFRRFLDSVDHPSATDDDGRYRFPLRAALSRYTRTSPLTARVLYQLALVDGDWRRWSDNCGYNHEVGEKYLLTALYELWREFSVTALRT